MKRAFVWWILGPLMTVVASAAPAQDEIKVAMKKAAVFYRESVALNGGCVYYSPDLSKRLGEGGREGVDSWSAGIGAWTNSIDFESEGKGTARYRNGKATNNEANYPEYDWRTEGRIKDYWDSYHLNDGIALSVAETLLAGLKVPGLGVSSAEHPPTVEEVVNRLDEKGRWISKYDGEPLSGQPKFRKGEGYLHSGVFARNLVILSDVLE